MQVFNDMCVLAAVEDGQGPCIALDPHVGICWIDGDSNQMHHEVTSKDGAHALAQQVKGSLHTLPAETPKWSPPPYSSLPETQPVPHPISRSLELPVRTLQCSQAWMKDGSSHVGTHVSIAYVAHASETRPCKHRAQASLFRPSAGPGRSDLRF